MIKADSKPLFKHFKPMDQWQYLKIRIWSDEDLEAEITELSFRMSIQQALETIFGHVGASCYINILDWNQYHNEGVIKVKQSELITVWSALINHQFLITSKPCTFDILASSAHLISLVQH